MSDKSDVRKLRRLVTKLRHCHIPEWKCSTCSFVKLKDGCYKARLVAIDAVLAATKPKKPRG